MKKWIACQAAILFLLPVEIKADAENQSSHTIYVKPEHGNTPVAVRPGYTFRGAHDGIAVPEQHPDMVFKSVDNVNITVDRAGNVFISGGSFVERAGQSIIGGWKHGDFKNQHRDWKPLIELSRQRQTQRGPKNSAETKGVAVTKGAKAGEETSPRSGPTRSIRNMSTAHWNSSTIR